MAMIAIGMYFLPTIVAAIRRSDRVLGVFLVNLFFGWTGIGWVIALIMAVRDRRVYYGVPYAYYPMQPRRF
jgi:hypothetical protein